MNKIAYLFIFMFLVIGVGCSNENDASVVVSEYIEYCIEKSFTDNFNPRKYYHPDAIWPGGESERVFNIVSYSIIKVEEKEMNVNYINPKDEFVSIVTVEFTIIDNLVDRNKKTFESTYFLVNSDNRLLIIRMSYPDYKFRRVK